MDKSTIAYWNNYADAARKGTSAFRAFLQQLETSREPDVLSMLITNPGPEPMELALEPLGMFHAMPAATTYELIFLWSNKDTLSIEHTTKGMIVWEIGSYDYGLFHNGVSLEIWPDVVLPSENNP